jgi:glycine/D-amino acid oxidase-like deaminating enzyme/nitrite reductase/ring-hydroxylating ferredoxin subunit
MTGGPNPVGVAASAHAPYWQPAAQREFRPLDRDVHVDAAIVGGGIAGITSAYLLKKAGYRVALLERGRMAEAESGHTTAHLTCVTDLRLSDMARTFGTNHAQAVWDAGLAAIAQIHDTIRSERIECGFARVPGYLHAPPDAISDAELQRLREDAALAHELGFDAEYVERVPWFNVPGVRIEHQARFHPRQYLAALLDRIDGNGSLVCEHTKVEDASSEGRVLKAAGHTVECDLLIITTHTPIVGASSFLEASLRQTKLALYTTYVVAARVPPGSVPDALFWDTSDPYTYVRLHREADFDEVILGGEDHKTGQVTNTNQCYERLERTMRRHLPAAIVTHRWSGQVIETADGLPYIGEAEPHQFVATGFAGNGMTFGTLSAMMAADLLAARRNPWTELFAVDRTKILGAAWDYIKENSDYPYYMIRDRFAGVEGRSLRAVNAGEGRVIDLNGRRVAAYRDDDGVVTVRSATCTHLGCIVHWNNAEHTWDCPCHGSRFTPKGQVIGGPAESPLPE